MNQIRQTYIYCIFALREHITRIIGYHYPREIISLIVMSICELPRIVCGYNHTFMIYGTDVYAWGCNERGQTGLNKKLCYVPHKIPLLNVITISCGYSHTVALTKSNVSNSNKMYVWGDNSCGQFGTNEYECMCADRCECDYKPHFVDFDCMENYKYDYPLHKHSPREHILENIIMISCGADYTIAVTRVETLQKIYVWGNNMYGQLGLGDYCNYYVRPYELILPLPNVYCEQISCGAYHTVILIKNKIYICGGNNYGQLGLGDSVDKHLLQELNLPDVISVGCGTYHTVALVKSTNLNKLYVWGGNKQGQLGLGDHTNRSTPQEVVLSESILSVSCGGSHTIALTQDGLIYVWGINKSGQLGLSECGLKNQNLPQKLIFHELIHQVSCGYSYTIVVTKLGKIYVWGCNEDGRLGLGDHDYRDSPQELIF